MGKPDLKDYGLSKARNTELCIQASRQALMRLCLEWRRLGDSPLAQDMYSLVETEEELEQLFNAGMNNGQDKEDKEETNQQDRKDEDENQTSETSEETGEKKTTKKFTV